MTSTHERMQASPIHEWIGVVAADKQPNDITIEVTVIELVPALTGQVNTQTNTQTVTLSDLNGASINSSITTKTTITAYYYGGDTNRPFPPDVVRGEQVKILQYANNDRYYWMSMGRDDQLRYTETYRTEVKNRKNFSDPSDDNHTYSIELDTKRSQHIRLLTSNGNGEKHVYVLLLDAGASRIQLSDEIGNSLTMDSEKSKVILRNSSKSFLMLNGQDIIMGAPRDIVIKADRQMVLGSPLITISNQKGAGILAIKSTAIAIQASNNIVTTSPAIGLVGAVQVPQILTVSNLRADLTAGTPVGTNYPSSSIDLQNGTGSMTGASPDATMPSSQRHAAAWEQFNSAMAVIKSCFDQVQGSIGVPTTQGQLLTLGTEAEMTNLTGV